MAKTNKKPDGITLPKTHEGAIASRISQEQELRRTVMACLLWEDSFYEDGISIADRIKQLVDNVDSDIVAKMAIEARTSMKLRHIPLLMVKLLSNKGYKVVDVLSQVIQRPDELSEFLSLYWKDGKCPLSAQVKKGLAKAFIKFDEYQLAKYNRDEAIRLRDVLFLCHANPIDEAQAEIWKRLINNTLQIPDTWEVNLSTGKDKKETWERLINENKLGAMAMLRNLRNMQNVSVSEEVIKKGLRTMKVERVLPFRFISAAKYGPRYEAELEEAMFKCLSVHEKLKGKTILLVDVSGSMDQNISAKSELQRADAAKGLAMLAREICEDVVVYTFSQSCILVPARRGFALAEAISKSQSHGSTYLGEAVQHINNIEKNFDRFIVITDEQSHDEVNIKSDNTYIVNVGTYQNGVSYNKHTVHISGWSEKIIDYIYELENLRDNNQ